MYLKSLELSGFKSFGKKEMLEFSTPITAIVGPNGSGKSNTAEAFRFVLGEQSMKSLRGKRGEDLIWNGSQGASRGSRAMVRVTFENTPVEGVRPLNIDFDEVAFERVVYRDGTNEYLINGSKVRLKDVTELLAGANVGSSGHHIISQGEADRVLAASPRERRQMIEDALGLRAYQYKKEESRKKLEKTEENKTQVEALRRESAPHLKFLERQVQKLERARDLREKLTHALHEYLAREEHYLAMVHADIAQAREEPQRILAETEARLKEARHTLERERKGDEKSEELLTLERSLEAERSAVAQASRTLGRMEGQIAFEERRMAEEARKAREGQGLPVPFESVRGFADELLEFTKEAFASEELTFVRRALTQIEESVHGFLARHRTHEEAFVPDSRELERLKREHEEGEAQLKEAQIRMHTLEEKRVAAEAALARTKDESRVLERDMYALMSKASELRATLQTLDSRRAALARDEEELKRELAEAVTLIGREVLRYKDVKATLGAESLIEERGVQLERRRELEKLKIRLEEIGGASAEEIMREYTEVKERDTFLERELADLTSSAAELRTLIEELERELGAKFKAGVADISAQFNTFFTLMFGGGSASLSLVTEKRRGGIVGALFGNGADEEENEEGDEEKNPEEGIEVEVSLPKKKVQNLLMLSGGERALTSIALIFAMSQVNPPPFLILDETDAALDEANSRRYGDMIENLAKKSQLILITHNRETMSRAGILYGVTMGADGISKLLSVKFDEAVAVAK